MCSQQVPQSNVTVLPEAFFPLRRLFGDSGNVTVFFTDFAGGALRKEENGQCAARIFKNKCVQHIQLHAKSYQYVGTHL